MRADDLRPSTISTPPAGTRVPTGRKSALAWVLGSLALGSLAGTAGAQDHLYTHQGGSPIDLFGMSVSGGHDVDGDGLPDIVAGGYRGTGIMGLVRSYSGATGALIHEHIGASSQGIGLQVCLVGDQDNDGHSEYAAATLSAAPVQVYSGATGGVFTTLPNARGLYNLGDLDGDLKDDVLIGSEVYSVASGALILSLGGSGETAPAGNLDGDATSDFCRWEWESPDVALVAGAGGTVIRTLATGNVHYARGLGDIDGDGFDEIGVHLSGGDLQVFDGSSGALRLNLSGIVVNAVSLPHGRTIDPFGDINQDGAPDFLVGTGPAAVIVSGIDGCELARFEDPSIQAFTVAKAGDVDNDGFDDIVVGDPLPHAPTSAGALAVYRYLGQPGTKYCVATPNSTGSPALLTVTGSTSQSANNLGLRVGPVPAGTHGIFYYGDTQVQVPFGHGFRCVASITLGTIRLPVVPSTPNGCMAFDVDNTTLPAHGAWIAGTTWNVQAWYRDTGAGFPSFNLSDAVELTFTP